MSQIANIIELFNRIENDHLSVHQERCVVVRDKNATCTRCVDACTSGCISCADNHLVVAPEKCIGCGTCATACPTSAIELSNPTDKQIVQNSLAAAEANHGTAVIACDEILSAASGLYDPRKVVSTPCIGRIDESILMTLASRGVSCVRLTCGQCETCDHNVGLKIAKSVEASAKTLLDAWNSPMKIEISQKLPTSVRLPHKGYDSDKRKFLSSLTNKTKHAAADAADIAARDALGQKEVKKPTFQKVTDSGVLPQFVPNRRRNLMTALQALGEPNDVMVDTRLWGNVIIHKDKCTSCRMCATFCPTGAIQKFDTKDGKIGIVHIPAECSKCHTCVDICPVPGAIELSDEVFARDIAHKKKQVYTMRTRDIKLDDPHQIVHTMRKVLGSDQIYEG